MSWSNMFKIMETIRKEFGSVEDYSISETTLEQVFISFAKQQKSSEQINVEEEAEEIKDVLPDENSRHRSLVRHLSSVSRTSVDYTKL